MSSTRLKAVATDRLIHGSSFCQNWQLWLITWSALPSTKIFKKKSSSRSKQYLDRTTSIRWEPFSHSRKKLITLPFLGRFPCTLYRTFDPFGLWFAHYNLNSLSKLSVNLKDRIPWHKENGVYRLECNACHSVYLGAIDKSLITRIWEQVNSYASRSPDFSAFWSTRKAWPCAYERPFLNNCH